MERKIVWNKRPVKFFLSALTWISKDSVKQAERIERDTLAAIESLVENPEKFPPDKFKKNNTGHFRAFEMLSFRVSYRYTSNQIRILRIRHVKQKPKEY